MTIELLSDLLFTPLQENQQDTTRSLTSNSMSATNIIAIRILRNDMDVPPDISSLKDLFEQLKAAHGKTPTELELFKALLHQPIPQPLTPGQTWISTAPIYGCVHHHNTTAEDDWFADAQTGLPALLHILSNLNPSNSPTITKIVCFGLSRPLRSHSRHVRILQAIQHCPLGNSHMPIYAHYDNPNRAPAELLGVQATILPDPVEVARLIDDATLVLDAGLNGAVLQVMMRLAVTPAVVVKLFRHWVDGDDSGGFEPVTSQRCRSAYRWRSLLLLWMVVLIVRVTKLIMGPGREV
ncbi:hypothetical protein MFIFM68171_08250 [Madurella fahalii]|uniref:Uncharacterized protein n=1 Tax=Madurella fahalii TaxID=1157608 RepID=A0ABQ0GK13_9PEZI